MTKTTGIVKWFNDRKGFGFLTTDGSNDIFVHYSSITNRDFKTLSEGEKVSFELLEGPKGSQAINVSVQS